MQSTLFEKMQRKVVHLLKEIQNLPFNKELLQGVLPEEKFVFYLKQDALYLADFSRALSLIAARLVHHHHSQQFIQFAREAIQAERELHSQYLKPYQVSVTHHDKNPACFMYTNYLLKMASTATVEEAVASVLPCFWVYREVGKEMIKQAHHYPNNPYQDWIALYSGEAYDTSVNAAIAITNELSDMASDHVQQKMLVAFECSTQLEWLFWDRAYKQEKWFI